MGPASALTTGALSQSGREMLKSFQPACLRGVSLPTTVHLTLSKSSLHWCPEGSHTHTPIAPYMNRTHPLGNCLLLTSWVTWFLSFAKILTQPSRGLWVTPSLRHLLKNRGFNT